jgi:hypothetical protein
MVVLGIDAHERSHTVVTVDDAGRNSASAPLARPAPLRDLHVRSSLLPHGSQHR